MSEKCAYLVESGESKFCRLAEANIQKVVQRAAADRKKAEAVVEAAKSMIRYLQHAPEAIGVLQSDDTALDNLIEAVEEWEAQHGMES